MSKIPKFCFALLVAAATAVPAQAGIIHDLIGEQSFAPLSVGLENPANAINIDGTLHVTGQFNGTGAVQMIDLTTGAAGTIQQFHSLNGLGGGSGVEEAVQLDDGSILYLGSSAFGSNPISATYWLNDPTNPVSNSAAPNTTSFLEGASANGTIIGNESLGAAVGPVGGTLQLLPGGGGSQNVIDITADAQYIVGDSIWALGENGYQTVNTLGFQVPENGALPTQWGGSAIDPVTGQAVLTGTYVDLLTFQTNTGFWSDDGTLLGTFGGGVFQDFEIWEGQLVAGLNGLDNDGHLLAISDFSSMSILDLTGQQSMLRENGLFVGSAGFLLDGPNGTMVTSHATNDVSAVPEPSSLVLWFIGGVLLWMKRQFGWFLAS